MVRTQLRAVAEGEIPKAPAVPLTVTEAAAAGSHRDLLMAMRTRIARSVEDPKCPPRDLAALTRRLQDIAREIEAIDAEERKGDPVSSAAATPDDDWAAV